MDISMRAIIFFLSLTFLSLQYKLWLGDGSVSDWLHLEKKCAAQLGNNQTLAARNHALEADIMELKSGDQALEEQARFELGMVKQGEQYYQFVD
jgi:cell division protein FtsB